MGALSAISKTRPAAPLNHLDLDDLLAFLDNLDTSPVFLPCMRPTTPASSTNLPFPPSPQFPSPPSLPSPPHALPQSLHQSLPSPALPPSGSSPPSPIILNPASLSGPAPLPLPARRRPGKKPASRRFACRLCSNTFSRKDNLTTHARVHTGERPFACAVCPRRFMWPSSARTHELTHARDGTRRRRAPRSQPVKAEDTAVAPVPAPHFDNNSLFQPYAPHTFPQSSQALSLNLFTPDGAEWSPPQAHHLPPQAHHMPPHAQQPMPQPAPQAAHMPPNVGLDGLLDGLLPVFEAAYGTSADAESQPPFGRLG